MTVLTIECANVLEKREFKAEDNNKVTYIKTEELAADAYFFKAGQVLKFHRHPSDQIFFVNEGEGEFILEAEGKEQKITLKPGVMVLAPKGVFHKVVAIKDLIVSQATKLPTGLEWK